MFCGIAFHCFVQKHSLHWLSCTGPNTMLYSDGEKSQYPVPYPISILTYVGSGRDIGRLNILLSISLVCFTLHDTLNRDVLAALRELSGTITYCDAVLVTCEQMPWESFEAPWLKNSYSANKLWFSVATQGLEFGGFYSIFMLLILASAASERRSLWQGLSTTESIMLHFHDPRLILLTSINGCLTTEPSTRTSNAEHIVSAIKMQIRSQANEPKLSFSFAKMTSLASGWLA